MGPSNVKRFHHVVIVGPGAIGTTLGVRLACGGSRVTVLDHRPDRAARIAREGLGLRTASGELLRADVGATTEAGRIEAAELVLVCVKCPALEPAGRQLATLEAPAAIVALENGLGVLDALQRGLGDAAARHATLQAVTYQAASPDPDDVVRHVANLPTLFEGSPRVRPSAERAAATFTAAGLPARVEAHLLMAVWRKVVVNAAINPLTALERVANGALAEREDLRAEMLALAREAGRVARAEGLAIGDKEAEQSALRAATQTARNVSSMRQDVEAGCPTEIEFLSGALLRLADRHGLRMPHTARVSEAVRRLAP